VSLSAAWTVSLPEPAIATPASDSERAYVALRDGTLVALALTDGAIAWTAPAPDASGAPVAGDGLVFVARPRLVQAFDAQTGEPKWRAEMESSIGAPLFWDNGWLLAITDRGEATMFRAATGEVLWKQTVGTPVGAKAAAANQHVYVLLDDSRVVALALGTGAADWETRLPGRPTSLHPLDDRLFVGCDDKFFYCLDAGSGKAKWRWRTGGTIVGTASVDDQLVYFLSLDSVLRALDRGNGDQKWKTPLPYQPTAGPFLSAPLLLVPGTAAELAAFSTFDGKAAGSVKLAGEAAAPPHFLPPAALGEAGRVLVVTGDGKAQLLVPGLPVLRGNPLPVFFAMPPTIGG
jgi:eukaryotic-like serine/threonine-protein kinase